ncbi:Glutathione S-transferase [Aureococcus anophagefferens]|uniref:Glutathione S-transferase n=1 Tax=Aureococcus anophagefferens TaxID=44056 RepID=A0ABR1GAD7_AURAN
MGFGRPRSGGAARVFADLGDMENEAKRDDGFRAPQELKPLVRPQHSKNPSRANGADFRVARKGEAPPRAPPPKRLVFGRKKFDPFAAPEVAERMAKTLKKAAKDARRRRSASARRRAAATRRSGPSSGSRRSAATTSCPARPESRWAAHFDDDVMVVEADDGSVAYAHHATGKAATGPTEASVVEGPTIWVTLIDPVSGQVYYYSRACRAKSSWAPPRWIDYYDPDARCAADSPRRRGADDEAKRDASPAKRPASAHAPPSHVRSPPGVNKENGGAPLDKLSAILFSYQKRPKRRSWDPAATQAPADAASPEAKKRDSGASLPVAAGLRAWPPHADATRRGTASIRATLYRDAAAWCPYCQKVWLLLEELRVPYRVEKVPLSACGYKPTAFSRRVDGGKLPALELDGELHVESEAIMDLLVATFGTAMDGGGDDERWKALEDDLMRDWFSLAFYPIEGERLEAARDALDGTLRRFDDMLGATPGPWALRRRRAVALGPWDARPSYRATGPTLAYSLVMAIPSQNGPGYAVDDAKAASARIYGLDGAWELPLGDDDEGRAARRVRARRKPRA